jgi:hypothetical protein
MAETIYTSVKDSGQRQEFSTGAKRDTQGGKGRFDLLPGHALTRLARHFENGAVKYGDDNWRKGMPLNRYLDSAFRHLVKFMDGERDEDHAIAVVWNMMCLIETEHMIKNGVLSEDLDTLRKDHSGRYTPPGPEITSESVVDKLPTNLRTDSQAWPGYTWAKPKDGWANNNESQTASYSIVESPKPPICSSSWAPQSVSASFTTVPPVISEPSNQQFCDFFKKEN